MPGGETEWGNLIKRPLIWLPENGNGNFPYSSIPNTCSERLLKMLMKPHDNHPGIYESALPVIAASKGTPLDDMKAMQGTVNQMPQLNQSVAMSVENQTYSQFCASQSNAMISSSSKINLPGKLHPPCNLENQTADGISNEKLKSEPDHSTDKLSQVTSVGESNEEKSSSSPTNLQNCGNQMDFQNQNQAQLHAQSSLWSVQPLLEPSGVHPQQINISQADSIPLSGSLPFLDTDEWISNPSCISLPGMYGSSGPLSMFGLQEQSAGLPDPSIPLMNQGLWDQQLNNLRFLSPGSHLIPLAPQEPCNLNSSGAKDLSDESNDQSGIYDTLNIDVGNGGSAVIDPSVSNVILDEFCTSKGVDFQNPSDCLVGNFSSSQDVQSQITSASLADSQAFSQQEFPDSLGGTPSSNVDFEKGNYMQNNSWQQVAPRVRTYTKVLLACVGSYSWV